MFAAPCRCWLKCYVLLCSVVGIKVKRALRRELASNKFCLRNYSAAASSSGAASAAAAASASAAAAASSAFFLATASALAAF